MLTESQKTLLHLLKQYVPGNDDERRVHRYALTYVEMETLVFDERVLPVHVTGSGVVLDWERQRVLLRDSMRLLGGHDVGVRDVAATALAHARDESGVALEHDRPLRVFDLALDEIAATDDVRAHRHLDVAFLFRVTDDVDAPPGTRWVGLDEMARGGDARLARIARKLLAGPGAL